jgi:hypothetical protein
MGGDNDPGPIYIFSAYRENLMIGCGNVVMAKARAAKPWPVPDAGRYAAFPSKITCDF